MLGLLSSPLTTNRVTLLSFCALLRANGLENNSILNWQLGPSEFVNRQRLPQYYQHPKLGVMVVLAARRVRDHLEGTTHDAAVEDLLHCLDLEG
jgi:hypothetical protein